MNDRVLTGTGRWGFKAVVDGSDILVTGGVASWFGGSNDPDDNGQTASGISTRNNPNLKACSLPMNDGPCHGSPLPVFPWRTEVTVTHLATGDEITVPLIDLGPSRDDVRGVGRAIDLTTAAFQQFTSLDVGLIAVNYRILGGARYV